jgi:uncharacterized membrane protein YfcA
MVTYFAATQHVAQATSLAVVIPTGAVGALVYGLHGNIDLAVTLNLIVGSMLGATFGRPLAKKTARRPAQKTVGVMLVLTGVRMVLG